MGEFLLLVNDTGCWLLVAGPRWRPTADRVFPVSLRRQGNHQTN
jgi:hypothetical protein